MKTFPEIERLKEYFKKFSIHIEKFSRSPSIGHIWVLLSIHEKSWNIYVDDEYDNFDECDLVAFYLTLNALEQYKECPDFLVWANDNYLNSSSTSWLTYYKSLDLIVKEVEEIIGKIDSQISAYDYSLGTGLGRALLKGDN